MSKELGLLIIATLLSVLVALLAALTFTTGGAAVLVWSLGISIFAWLVAQVLALTLSQRSASIAALIVLPAVAALAAGWGSLAALVGAMFMALAQLAAWRVLRTDRDTRTVYSTTSIFKAGTRYVVIALALGITGIGFSSLQSTVSDKGLQFSEAQLALFLRPAEPLFQNLLPGFKSGQTVDGLIDSYVRQQLAREGRSVPVDAVLPPDAREQARQQIAEQFNIEQPLSGDESVAAVLALRLNGLLQSLTQGNPILFTLVILLLLLLTIRALLPIPVWVTLGLIAGAVAVGQRVGLFRFEEEQIIRKKLLL